MVFGVLAVVGFTSKAASASTLTTNFIDRSVFTGLDTPVAMRFAPDGRVFVAEKRGVVKSFPNTSTNVATVVADIRTDVYNFWDRGLLGLTIDPAFPTKPYIYVSYVYDHILGDAAPAPHWGTPNTDSDPCPNPPGDTQDGCVASGRIARLTLDVNGVMIPGSQKVLVEDFCQQFGSHSMGALDFGPDGNLYASAGDGASFTFSDLGQRGAPMNPCHDPIGSTTYDHGATDSEGGSMRSQDTQTNTDPAGLDGTIIRIDPTTGDGVPSNPFYAAKALDPNAARILATGLRNPFRWTFRPGTNELYAGDVGWGTWEEVNKISDVTNGAATNFGWPCYEGPDQAFPSNDLCKTLYTRDADKVNYPQGIFAQPFFKYHHGPMVDLAPSGPGTGQCDSSKGSSTTGVAFYKGGQYPSKYNGAMFMADYAQSCISVMFPGTGTAMDPASTIIFASNVQFPVDLQTGPNGDIFYVSPFTGNIYEIVYTGMNHAPNPVLNYTNPVGGNPLSVQFDGLASSDPDTGDTLTYQWDFTSDGTWDSTQAKPLFTYPAKGSYTAKLRVTDNHGAYSDAMAGLNLSNNVPVATIAAPANGSLFSVGQTINFSGSATDVEDGVLAAGKVNWDVTIKHCIPGGGCHTHPYLTFAKTLSGSFTAPDHDYPSQLVITMTATDSGGAVATKSITLDPKKATISYTAPPGTNFNVPAYAPAFRPAPATLDWIQGGTAEVQPPNTLVVNGVNVEFDGWSDGAAQNRTDKPAVSGTVTASYSTRTISIGDATTAEGNSGTHMLTFPVSITPASNQNINVSYSTTNGSASAGSDFVSTAGILVIPAGTTAKSISVPIVGDLIIEPTETFTVKLSGNTAGALGKSNGIGTIVNDDGVAGLSVNDVSVAEGNSGTTNATFTVTLSTPASATVSVNYATNNGTALAGTDYTTATGTISFNAGEITKTFTVPIIGDTVFEPDELFTVNLTGAVNASILVGSGTGTIINDDAQVLPKPPVRRGYYLVAGDGGVFTYGDAKFFGSTGAMKLNQPVVGMAVTHTGDGYYLVAADGGIFAYGDARFYGSTGNIVLNKPVIGMAITPSGNGYWLFASDGGVFAFGDAPFLGSTGALKLRSPIVGMAARPQADGYWLFSADGTLYEFGAATNLGSITGTGRTASGMAATPTGNGYWIVSARGTVSAFGDAIDYGSPAGAVNAPVVGMSPTPTGQGYWIFGGDGGVFTYGDAGYYGSAGAIKLNAPMVGGVGGFG